ncbi:hypothetical protein Poly24_03740 [Rosistilla carotiformis]|uniref:DUF1573 domain-containing protein n=1 Tax=Rosistilla carotiformis TaxID=2528017 RepID=A0A518JMH5_9BACT|nr:DUF1573 domain-containing protein [Rosistilla carotiformis]QDV66687.1 hypothetical protein Poly24_03740 [Rosistilla carotiformis]
MRVLAIIALALIGGISIGKLTGSRQISESVDHFGPFTEVEGFDEEQLPAYLSSLIPDAVGKIEVIGEKEFDFGVMHRNTEGEHAFKIRNVGTGPLRMKVTGSTCKCTVGELENESLAPGESSEIKLTWKTRSSSAEFAQTATIQTNDPENIELKLTVHGALVESLLTEPTDWSVGNVTSGEPIELKLTAYSYDAAPIEIVSAEFLDAPVQELAEIHWTERKPDEKTDGKHHAASQVFEFDVKVHPGLRQGAMNHLMRVNYKSEDLEEVNPSFDINLSGKIVGPLRLLGGSKLEQSEKGGGGGYRFNFGTVRKGDPGDERIHLVIRGKEYDDLVVKIGEIKPDNVFAVSFGEENRRGSLRSIPIDIKIKPEAPVGIVRGIKSLDTGYVMLEPQNSQLSPLKLWLTVEVTAVDN